MDEASDESLHLAAFEVARNLVGYRNYGGDRSKALKALRRRQPGVDGARCEQALDRMCAVVATAREAVRRHQVRPEHATGPARFEDIDHEACMAAVDRHDPGVALDAKRAAVSWAVLVGYLK